ncbi:MAG: T9SS type A sorting domain-containing protein [Bacteroidota bacterium]
MKRIVLLFLFFSLKIVSQEPTVHWGGNIGGTSYDSSQAANIDANGNLFLTGGFGYISDFDFGTGTYTMTANGQSAGYLAKYNTNGQLQWGKKYTGNYFTFGFGVDFDGTGNVYAMGTFNASVDFDPGPAVYTMTAPSSPYVYSDIYLTKLDNNGNFVFAKQITGQGVKDPTAFKVDTNGNMYVTGYFNNVTQFSSTVSLTPSNGVANTNIYDIFVAKYTSTGNLSWVKQIGNGSISQRTEEMVLDANGNIYLCGQFHGITDFDPSPTGTFTLTPSAASGMDFFILKLDNNGNFAWAKSMGGPNGNFVRSMQRDASGNLYLTGTFTGTCDFDPSVSINSLTTPQNSGSNPFLLKLSPDGDFIWVKHLLGNGYGNTLAINNGKISVAGVFYNTCDFSCGAGTAIKTTAGNGDAFMAEFNNDGTFNWVKCFGGSQDDEAMDVLSDTSGNYFLFGDFNGTANIHSSIGNLSLTANGSQDAFIIKMGPELSTTSFSTTNFSLYPNPSENELHLTIPDGYSDGILYIYSTNGKLIKKAAVTAILNIESLSVGTYFLTITNSADKSITQKFIKK